MYSLGLDTSNYKTSIALVDEAGNIIVNIQEFLTVKTGERGLRQSEAFYQHVNKLPDLVNNILSVDEYRNNIKVVSVSNKPRPIEGSYMPVFNAGYAFAKTISDSLNVPLYSFSHQEGHIEAIKFYSSLKNKKPIVCFHFSGGTTEAILVDDTYQIVGKTLDISYGQILDRIGVLMGFNFPCGNKVDKLAMSCKPQKSVLSPIKVNDCKVNLSGIETQANGLIGSISNDILCYSVMLEISKSITKMIYQIKDKYNINDFIFSGGVSSSLFLRNYINNNINDLNIIFGNPILSTDNAVGIALLGGSKIWH